MTNSTDIDNWIDTSFNSTLEDHNFFKLHKSLLPYIGSNYKKYKILHIGESHYLSQTIETEKYSIEDFNNRWWNDECTDILAESPNYVDTRKVINNYLNDKNGSYTIFTNVLKSFSKAILKEEIINISKEHKQKYTYFAFMNYFQMPSLHSGKGFWRSLCDSAEAIGNPELALSVWDYTVSKSTEIVDYVIETINPNVIVFTSTSAGDAYKNSNGKYMNDKRVIYTSHPAYPYTWYKPLSRFNGKRGVDVFEDNLRFIINNEPLPDQYYLENKNLSDTCLNFLICCYFGQSKDLLKAAIDRAYIDMASHTLIGLNNYNEKWYYRYETYNLISKAIIEYSDKESFENWHKGIIDSICKIYPNGKLSEGQAQKWLNMTIKYIYVFSCILNDNDERLEKFHNFLELTTTNNYYLPIDSHVLKETNIDGAWSKFTNKEYEIANTHIEEYLKVNSISDGFLWELNQWEELIIKHKSYDTNSYANYYYNQTSK